MLRQAQHERSIKHHHERSVKLSMNGQLSAKLTTLCPPTGDCVAIVKNRQHRHTGEGRYPVNNVQIARGLPGSLNLSFSSSPCPLQEGVSQLFLHGEIHTSFIEANARIRPAGCYSRLPDKKRERSMLLSLFSERICFLFVHRVFAL